MSSWHSYGKIYNLGHAALRELLSDEVTVEEKIDGSQFSFGIFNGEIKCRSKGQQLILDAPEKMFQKAVETVKELAPLLKDGYTYRGEYLQKPKHNALAYDRYPKKHIILFDISPSQELYLTYEEKAAEANRIGLEVVPLLYKGIVTDVEFFMKLIDTVSCLGGQKIEGVVVKNYSKFGTDKKVLLGKHVSESFKEVHKASWKESNPSQSDFIALLGSQYKTPARWNKGVQHLKEKGLLENSPKDIGNLIKEVQEDLLSECSDEIKEALFKWIMPQISRIATSGLPQWYKEELLKSQFEGVE